jgi:hypothetical protein
MGDKKSTLSLTEFFAGANKKPVEFKAPKIDWEDYEPVNKPVRRCERGGYLD